MSGHTPGPWTVKPRRTKGPASVEAPTGRICTFREALTQASIYGDEAWANANLIARAPDHADIGWAMCVAAGRWEPFGSGQGEFCMNGLRFLTKLDEFGIPAMTKVLRAHIAKARGGQS